jgi:hypothetical protein
VTTITFLNLPPSPNADEELKVIIKKRSSSEWLKYIRQKYLINDLNSLYPDPHVSKHLITHALAIFAEKIILWTNRHRKPNPKKANNILSDFGTAIKIILSQIINDPEHTDHQRYVTRNAQLQYSLYDNKFAQFQRLCTLFKKLPLSDEMKLDKNEFDFHAEFLNHFSMSIDEYLTCAFLFMTYIMKQDKDIFSRAELIKYCEYATLGNFKESSFLLILKSISADRSRITLERQNFLPKDNKFNKYNVPLLKLYPILHLNDKYENEPPEFDLMISPLPYLIINRIHDIIYFKLKEKCGDKFTEWFGKKLLESYCRILIKNIFPNSELISEEDVRKTYPTKKGKAPDYIVTDGDTGILIECKAARVRRGLTESNDEEEFKKCFEPITKAVQQLDEFSTAIKTKSPGLERFYSLNKIYHVIITWEEFSPLVDKIFYKKIIEQIYKRSNDEIPYRIFSIGEIERLQAALNKTDKNLDYFIQLFDDDNFFDKWSEITKCTKSKDSLLDEEFIKKMTAYFPFLKNFPEFYN